jgi:hypothetical protein
MCAFYNITIEHPLRKKSVKAMYVEKIAEAVILHEIVLDQVKEEEERSRVEQCEMPNTPMTAEERFELDMLIEQAMRDDEKMLNSPKLVTYNMKTQCANTLAAIEEAIKKADIPLNILKTDFHPYLSHIYSEGKFVGVIGGKANASSKPTYTPWYRAVEEGSVQRHVVETYTEAVDKLVAKFKKPIFNLSKIS